MSISWKESISWKDKRIVFVCAVLLGVPMLLPAFELSKADAQFMKKAAEANMTEAHLGQMAEAQSNPLEGSYERL